MQKHFDNWHFDLCIKEKQECAWSNSSDKPETKNSRRTASWTVSLSQYVQTGWNWYLFRKLSQKLHKMIKTRAEDKATYTAVYGSFRKISQQAEPDLTQFRKDVNA